jgi:hypothetical protein
LKKLVALLLVATMPVMAEEPEDPHLKPNLEDVVVTGYIWNTEELRGRLMLGLGGACLIHESDKTRDEWRFVRTSNQKPKKDK